MLAGALSYVALIALVAVTILSAGMAMTRMTIHRMMQPYLAAGYLRAESALLHTVAGEMQARGIPYPAPSISPLPPSCANAGCTYQTSGTITLTQASRPTPGPACDSSQTNCAPNVQTNQYVGESRLSALITVYLRNAQGAIVATRSGTVVLRTFKAPPYVAIAGSRTSAFDDVMNADATGDDGGAPDTAVRVEYRNQRTGARSDGSTWADASYSTRGASSGWSP